MKRVVLGFSGGVDSAVSAAMLKKQGYELRGLYLDNTDATALSDALRTAEFMDVPLKVMDVKAELEERVCRDFAEAYLSGSTPNPCIICNRRVKFKALLEYAGKIGAEHIATGHYARAEAGKLYKGRAENDQSYMLCRISREQLNALLLPLGPYTKGEVRQMARELELPVAEKPDSMEICFIPDKDYIGWLMRRGVNPPPGDFILHGERLGEHRGIHRYTVGQRLPGLYNGRKVYISRINHPENSIELALWEELFKTKLHAVDFNPLCALPENEPIRASVKVRHTKWEEPACTLLLCGGMAEIYCDEPVRAPAAGQSAVLYDGDRVLGGGFIA